MKIARDVTSGNHVEDHIDALALRLPAKNFDEEILAPIVDSAYRAEPFAGACFLGAAGRGEHPGAPRAGELDGRGSDAGTAVNEYGLARFASRRAQRGWSTL